MENATEPKARKPVATDGTAPAEEGSDLTGKTLGDFRILRKLGQGGMGQVYLAEQLSLKRKVALKVMRADLAANKTALERFKLEALAVARITHANIVQVYAISESDGLHYMALEYVEGRNLREYLSRKGPPELAVALSIMRQVAAALQRASELGIVHRDIKPENILLNRKGEVKVADFGLSRCFAGEQQPLNLTQSGVTMGTPLYMSPEQVQGQDIDPRTDIYSLGVTSYHMLTGEPPYQGKTAFEVAMQHVQGEPKPLCEVRPDLPAELAAVVHKMMAKEPANRYQTGRELLKDLTRLREGIGGISAGTSTMAVPAGSSGSAALTPAGSGTQLPVTLALPARGRRWLPWVVAGSILLALGAGAAFRLALRPTPTAPGEQVNAASTPANPDDVLERKLRERLQQPFNPAEPRQLREALDPRIELGLFYLRRRRLNDGAAFFKQLTQDPPREIFRYVGQMGQAMVLAFEDKPADSNKLFVEVVRERLFEKKKPPEERPLLLAYGEWWQMVDEALDRNVRNGQPLPPPLERFRWSPGKRPGPFGKPIGSGKSPPPDRTKPDGGERPPDKKGS